MAHSHHSVRLARIIFAVMMLASFGAPMMAAARVFSIEIVSVASDGTQANAAANNPVSSADGRYVAFYSAASNLVAGDTNNRFDVFVHDRSTGTTSRVSVASDGTQGNGTSDFSAISGDGRYVAFESFATNLVSGDTNGQRDIFVHDRTTGQTVRVSQSSLGVQSNGISVSTAISADGRYVAFQSTASNLVPGDTNGRTDVFVYTLGTGEISLVSVASDGTLGNNNSFSPALSADGRYIAFYSTASNLVAGDTNNTFDAFVHDRTTGQTTRVSIASDGTQGNGSSSDPVLSADGRYVAFESTANNLVSGDTNTQLDVFVHDRTTGQTTRVSVSSAGVQSNGVSSDVDLSADGRYVTFSSNASNLVAGDTNGQQDAFIHDRSTGQTRLVSTNLGQVSGNGNTFTAAISGNGDYIFFDSDASNLVSGDTNGAADIFAARLTAFTDTVGVFRPSVATFFLRNSNTGGLADIIQPFGSSTDVPLVGDWNGDDVSTIALYRQTDNTFFLNNQNTDGTPDITALYFAPRGLPVVGDWNSDGIDTFGLYREGLFMLSNSTTSGFPEIFIYFGDSALDTPLAGDWDGNGRDTVGLWRATTASFFLTNVSTSGFGTADIVINYGTSTDIPFIGDWDADGIDGIGVYRPSNGDVYLKNALSDGLPDILFNYGIAQDIPLAGVWQLPETDQANDGGSSAPIFVPKP